MLTGNPVPAQQLPFTSLEIADIPQGSRGVALADLDGNGRLDIAVANQVDSSRLAGNAVYLNFETGFRKLALAEGNKSAWSESAHAVDVDNDHDADLFFTTQFGAPNLLFLNEGKGSFVAADAGDLTRDSTNSPGACWCDYDRDGDLDVFIVNRDGNDDLLYSNAGNGRFVRMAIGPWSGAGGDGRSCAWGDLDGDGMPDLYVVNFVRKQAGKVIGKHKNFLYWNRGSAYFEAAESGVLVEDEHASYGVSLIDYDYDLDLDVYVSNVSASDPNAFYENRGGGRFLKRGDLALSQFTNRPSKGQAWGDFNNDKWLDLYVANGTEAYPEIQNYLFLGGPDFGFKRVYETLPAIEPHISAGTALGDLDGDGDLDIYVANWGGDAEANDLYLNQHRTNHWLKLRLVGVKSNSSGYGSWVILTLENGETLTRYVTGQTGYGSGNAPEVHFGLGGTPRMRSMEVVWPSGARQFATHLIPDTFYRITEDGNIEILSQ